jgi:hypothetical protein
MFVRFTMVLALILGAEQLSIKIYGSQLVSGDEKQRLFHPARSRLIDDHAL